MLRLAKRGALSRVVGDARTTTGVWYTGHAVGDEYKVEVENSVLILGTLDGKSH